MSKRKNAASSSSITTSSSMSSSSGISDYERLRMENIRRNEEFLGSIGLDDIKQSISTAATVAKAASKRGVEKKRQPPMAPSRRSTRVTVERLKSEIEEAGADGVDPAKAKLLEEMLLKKKEQTYEAEYQPPRERITTDVSLLAPTNLPDETDGTTWARPLVELLGVVNDKQSTASAPTNKKMKKESTGKPTSASPASTKTAPGGRGASSSDPTATAAEYSKRINKLTVAEDDIAKLTGNRIYSVWAHPGKDKLIVAAGDNQGDLGLWDVDNHDIGNKGVFKYHPHIETITKLHCWESDASKLYSASYDGTIRYLDLEKEAFVLGFTAPESLYDVSFRDAGFSSFDCNTVYLARGDGQVGMVDFRSRKCASGMYEWCHNAQDIRLNSVQQHTTDEHLMITASAGGTGHICVHDIRKAGASWKPLQTLKEHKKSINCAYVSPDGQFLVSVSQDDTIRTYANLFSSASTKSSCCSTNHNNHTGRWLTTFRPSFDLKHGSAYVMGSMAQPRRVEVFVPTCTTSQGSSSTTTTVNVSLVGNLQAGPLGSVCSINAFHPHLDVIVGGNSSGRVHILR